MSKIFPMMFEGVSRIPYLVETCTACDRPGISCGKYKAEDQFREWKADNNPRIVVTKIIEMPAKGCYWEEEA